MGGRGAYGKKGEQTPCLPLLLHSWHGCLLHHQNGWFLTPNISDTLKLPQVEWEICSRSTYNMAVSDNGGAWTEAEDKDMETCWGVRIRKQGRVHWG